MARVKHKFFFLQFTIAAKYSQNKLTIKHQNYYPDLFKA